MNELSLYDERYVEEEKVIQNLQHLGYEYKPAIKNMDTLYENLWMELSRINDTQFTDREKQELRSKVFESIEGIEYKINIWTSRYTIKRDNGDDFHVRFLSENNEENKLQVINQLEVVNESEEKNIYDVNILVNGIPLVHIELKKPGKRYSAFNSATMEMFNQIKRYRETTYPNTIMEFTRLFVTSDSAVTTYFANNKRILVPVSGGTYEEVGLKYTKPITWMNSDNQIIGNIDKFIEVFFNKKFIYKMLMDYYLTTDDSFIVLRPYQIHAIERTIEKVKSGKKEERGYGVGYIFHATGSGKTLTVYKLAENLSKIEGKKVIFVLDRRDLNVQTIKEFTKFKKDDTFNNPMSTDTLKKQLYQGDKFIITTIQKLNVVMKKIERGTYKRDYLKEYKDVILIFDECHRTVFGSMLKQIKTVLEQQGSEISLLGVTGTPIYKENAQSDTLTTNEIFGEELHKYLMVNAQKDGHILAFDIYPYHKIYIQSHDKLLSELTEPLRKEAITELIIKEYDKHTYKREFNAILATNSKIDLLEYYRLFKKKNNNLKVTAIFTSENEVDDINTDDTTTKEEKNTGLQEIIEDFNKDFGTNHSISEVDKFYIDVQEKVKAKEIDLVIVVDMLLTGFDSNKLSTIYLDKNIKQHRLIQAMSRVNRVSGPQKKYGNVVCFKPLEEEIKEALVMFNRGSTSISSLTARSVEERIETLQEAVNKLLKEFPDVSEVQNIGTKPRMNSFIKLFRDVTNAYSDIAFKLNFEEDIEGFTEKDFLDYMSSYNEIRAKVKVKSKKNEKTGDTGEEEGLEDFEFDETLVQNFTVDVEYILKSIVENIMKKDTSEEELTNMEALIKASALTQVNKETLLELVYKAVSQQSREDLKKEIEEKGTDNVFKEEKEKKGKEIFKKFAELESIPYEEIEKLQDSYDKTGILKSSNVRGVVQKYRKVEMVRNKGIVKEIHHKLLELFRDIRK